jgi:hypothetical protein
LEGAHVSSAVPRLPPTHTDQVTANRRTAEVVNNILGFQHDDSRIRTPAEVSAGVTPVNYAYDPGEVDRYGINTTPGTTDMTAAFNAATAVAALTGCIVTWGRTAPYRCNSPINATNIKGVIFQDRSSKNASANEPSILIGHTGHGFDLSASSECRFVDVIPTNVSGVVPKSIFFAARNAAGSGAGVHRFENCRTPQASTFSWFFYGYGSEEVLFDNCEIYNSQPGSGIFSHNATNPSAYTSTFLTIATGLQSNTTIRHQGGSYFNFGNSGSQNEVIFSLESVGNFTFRDGLWACPEGLAYVNVGGSHPSGWLTFDSIRGEPAGGTTPTYAITVTATGCTGANSHVNWALNNVYSDSHGEVLNFADGSEIQLLTTRCTEAVSGKLLNVLNMSRSVIEHTTNTVTGRIGGTVQTSTFVGSRSMITFAGTDTLNTGFDQATGRVWQSGDVYSAPSTACTGAITASIAWSLVQACRSVLLNIPAISATATAAASFTVGAVIPSQYRPSDNLRQPIIIKDNSTTPNQPGMIVITAATGVITIFKDIAGTANFTAAAGAGTPGMTEVSWNV